MLGNNRLINQIDFGQLPALGDGHIDVPFVPQVRNLGVILDSKLTLHAHIASVSSGVNGVLYKLQQLRDFTDLDLRKTLVSALVLPHINYCSAALLGAGVVNDLKLQRLMNKGFRFIFNLPCDASISAYRRRLGWLTIADSRAVAVATLTYIALKESSPPFLKELLLARIPSRSLRGHQCQELIVPNYRTDAFKSSFAVTAPQIWNSLPTETKEASSRSAFNMLI